ncbi:MAG: SAM-dependent chlorinase/fluorinase [Candidatus Poribacteria bacterium]|nr:SAM-dependent chlorinase/fluorinase [Candidatus Poribacteria bacterium]
MDTSHSSVITLTTDFGTNDPYIGVMKGVILNINPHIHIVDITHSIPPQNIHDAAFIIDSAYRYFPSGSIHVVVVDPGVGSTRRAIACQTETGCFVCPDNGVLSYVLDEDAPYRAVSVDNTEYCLPEISNTFHGRDIFAPIAAHLSRGIPLGDIGGTVNNLVRLNSSKAQVTKTEIIGRIIWIDSFGNLISNISSEIFESTIARENFAIRVGNAEINRLNGSYAESQAGECLAIIGSFGQLEISVNQGNAAQRLELKRGDPIVVRKTEKIRH